MSNILTTSALHPHSWPDPAQAVCLLHAKHFILQGKARPALPRTCTQPFSCQTRGCRGRTRQESIREALRSSEYPPFHRVLPVLQLYHVHIQRSIFYDWMWSWSCRQHQHALHVKLRHLHPSLCQLQGLCWRFIRGKRRRCLLH